MGLLNNAKMGYVHASFFEVLLNFADSVHVVSTSHGYHLYIVSKLIHPTGEPFVKRSCMNSDCFWLDSLVFVS